MCPIEPLGETLQQSFHELTKILHAIGKTFVNGLQRFLQPRLLRVKRRPRTVNVFQLDPTRLAPHVLVASVPPTTPYGVRIAISSPPAFRVAMDFLRGRPPLFGS